MQGKIHITFLCSRLDLPGGIERVIVNTANLFIEKGHTVTLLILDETEKSFYPLHPSIKIILEPLSFGISAEGNVVSRKVKLLSDVLKLRKILKKLSTQLLITTEYPFASSAIFAGARKFCKVISWEHHHFYELKRNSFWERIFRYTYPKLDMIVCLNEDEKNLYKAVNPNITIIPNFIKQAEKSSLTTKKILTVARLTAVKGVDLLLQAAKTVLQKHPDWQWKLIGDGSLKIEVQSFIEKEKLQNRFILQPPVSFNIIAEYQTASLYVMTSRNECFPMTLLEAQSTGLPCVAFDCETGPRHIIKNNEDGFLIEKENTDKMIEAIESLITNEERRIKMGDNAFLNVNRFSAEKIYDLWEKIF